MLFSDYFIIGTAKGGGDCLFDSIAQELARIRPGTNFSAKSLREDCAKYVQDLLDAEKPLPDWIREGFQSERDNHGRTIGTAKQYKCIGYTSEENKQNPKGYAIWGLPEVEGRILCEIYGVELHLVEKHVVEGQDVYVDIFINKSSNSQSPNKANKENTIHIINQGASHFVPLPEQRTGAYRDYLAIQGLSDDINPANGTTSQTDQSSIEIDELLSNITQDVRSKLAKYAKDLRDRGNPFTFECYIEGILKNIPEDRLKKLVSKKNSFACKFWQSRTTAVSRPAILGMTEKELNATLADVQSAELKINYQNRFKKEGVYLGEGRQNPCKPQKQGSNYGVSSGLVDGIVGHLLHNESLARASHAQKDHYEATRGEAQCEPKVRHVTGESTYPHSSVSKNRTPTAVRYDKSEAPRPTASQFKPSQPNFGQPQAPKPNAKPPKFLRFLRALPTPSLGKTTDYRRANERADGFVDVIVNTHKKGPKR